ncbi:MAG: Gfo/Idh/MocA family oxidoreductase [Chitinophagales bacterium]
MNKIETGLIGFGTGGRIFHAPFIAGSDKFTLKKINTTNSAAVLIAQSQNPNTEIVETADAIFTDEFIELVIIATPNTSHLPLAKKALLAGKHVIVEKPFTLTVAEADELIALARQQQKIITVHHNRRWDSDFQTIKKIVDGKLLGTLVEYEAHFDRFRNVLKENSWRETELPGSGILYDLGSHLIDQALCLFGMPEELFANMQVQRPGGKSIDHFELLLFYSGLKVTLKAGMLVREPLPHFILSGTQGSFVKYGMDVQEAALKEGHTPFNSSDWGVEPESIWGMINTDVNGNHQQGKVESERGDYAAFFENVYGAILSNEPLIVTPEQARDTIKIIELAMISNSEGRICNVG